MEYLLGTDARTPIQIKRAVIQHGSNGNNTIVAAVPGKKIRVLAATLVVAGAVNVRFRSGTGTTDLTGAMAFSGSGDGVVLGYNPLGWVETNVGELLNLHLSAAVNVAGVLQYIEI